MLSRLWILIIKLKKLTMAQILVNLKKIDHKHDKFITTEEFNKLTAENVYAR